VGGLERPPVLPPGPLFLPRDTISGVNASWRLVRLACCVLAGCGGSPDAKVERAVPFPRPDPEALVKAVAEPRDGDATRTRASQAIRDRWSDDAGQAVWAELARLEKSGLLELYGVEVFGLDDAHYEALMLARTPDGCFAIFGSQELHELREDPATAPRYRVAGSVFAQLRDRVAPNLPLDPAGRLRVAEAEPDVLIVHTLLDGRAASVLWHAPEAVWDVADEDALRGYREDRAVDAVVRAIRGHAPAPLFAGPGSTIEEAYARKSE